MTFWTYLVTALRQVYADHFARSLTELSHPGVSVTRTVLPLVLNELWHIGSEVVLVLDDFHVITDHACIESLRSFIDRLPPTVHLVVAARVEDTIKLARLRARGQLAELRARDLRFLPEEAAEFLNGILDLGLTPDELTLLEERTEGWAAGLYLAALTVRDQPDRHNYFATFTGVHGHLVDYFSADVLARLAEEDRSFLVQSAILEQLSGPLCDAVLERSDSAERLRRLAQQNLFVIPLDDQWQWYRRHQLFREFLLGELARRSPAIIPRLHRLAADWYHAAGEANAAMHHALAAQDFTLAGDLFIEYAYPLPGEGRLQHLVTWMDALPDDVLSGRPPLALATAWVAGLAGRSPAEVMRRVTMAETGTAAGPSMVADPSRAAAIARLRATYIIDNVGDAVANAETAMAAAPDHASTAYVVGRATLGFALYLAGRADEAQALLVEAVRAPLASQQAAGTSRALATLALVCLDVGEEALAEVLARRAERFAEERGLADSPSSWLLSVAMGRVLVREERLAQAEAVLAQRLEPHLQRLRSWPVFYALALLALVPVRHGRGHVIAARSLLEEARKVLRRCPDAGMLPGLLSETERALGQAKRRQTGLREELSEGELRVLRLLASDLTQREIARELYLSINTVKTHTRAIYTKLEVASRQEAVARARTLALIT